MAQLDLGVIGLGNIGGAVARNLVADGHAVSVFDLDPGRRAIDGALAASAVAEVAGGSDITFLSLPTPDAVRAVTDEWLTGARPGSIVVDLSTSSPEATREIGRRVAAQGCALVEAPLTGGAIGAQNRQLVFMVGGDDEAVVRVRPVLESLGRATFPLGGLGLGNTMKLLNSLLAYTTTWVSLEALSIAAKAGIDLRTMVEVVRTAGATNFYIDRGVEGLNRRGQPAMFSLALAAKDAALFAAEADTNGVPAPVAHAMREVLAAAVAAGLGDRDWGDLAELAEKQSGTTLRIAPADETD